MTTLDLHLDSPWIYTKRGQTAATVEQMKKGGLDSAVYALYLPDPLQTKIGADAVVQAINAQVAFVNERDEELKKTGGRAYMCLEGGRLLHQSMDRLRELAKAGIKYLTLTHNYNTFWADSATDDEYHKGLTEFGYRIVKECNRLGVLVDVSHASDKTFWNAIKASERPVIASHSGCRALVNHKRNLTDEMILAIAETGGIIGVPFAKNFVGPLWHSVAEHVDHIAKLVGADYVGIGSDLDGAVLAVGAETAASWDTTVSYSLAIRNYTDLQIDGISGGNALRLFNSMEK